MPESKVDEGGVEDPSPGLVCGVGPVADGGDGVAAGLQAVSERFPYVRVVVYDEDVQASNGFCSIHVNGLSEWEAVDVAGPRTILE
jgi:hypothetical protein